MVPICLVERWQFHLFLIELIQREFNNLQHLMLNTKPNFGIKSIQTFSCFELFSLLLLLLHVARRSEFTLLSHVCLFPALITSVFLPSLLKLRLSVVSYFPPSLAAENLASRRPVVNVQSD